MGAIEIVDVIGAAVLLVAVNEGTLEMPLAAKPIAVFELFQMKVAPEGVLIKLLIGTISPGQKVKFDSAVVVGTVFIVKVTLAVVVPHSLVTDKEIV